MQRGTSGRTISRLINCASGFSSLLYICQASRGSSGYRIVRHAAAGTDAHVHIRQWIPTILQKYLVYRSWIRPSTLFITRATLTVRRPFLSQLNCNNEVHYRPFGHARRRRRRLARPLSSSQGLFHRPVRCCQRRPLVLGHHDEQVLFAVRMVSFC